MGTLVDGIKDIFSTSKTTATHLPVCASDGTPQGRISAGDLASLFGSFTYNGDLNSAPNGIHYIAIPDAQALSKNCPTSTGGFGFLSSTYNASGGGGGQMYLVLGSRKMYTRVCISNEWKGWNEVSTDIPSFYKNYADLNALTNALVKQNALSIGNVMVVTNADSYTRFWPADRALESGIASIAVGAGIIENGRTLIIAKDATNKQWATSNVTGGTTAITDRRAAIADFDGRAKTTTILATLGDNAPAAKYCNEYYPSNVASTDGNMGAGRWWLPSLGEWAMVWAHVREVNFVLAAIGGTQISVGSGWTWSSTEYSAENAWRLTFDNGHFRDNGKTNNGSVRPVSAFY